MTKKKNQSYTLKVQPEDVKLTTFEELMEKTKKKKYSLNKKKNFKLYGYIIILLALVALVISLFFNRYVDQEYFSDFKIILMVSMSLLTLIFGVFITIKES